VSAPQLDDLLVPDPSIDGAIGAIELLDLVLPHCPKVIGKRLEHARDRLAKSTETHLFGAPSSHLDVEAHALAQLKTLALELHAAGTALDHAAEALKMKGLGLPASHTKQAANKAHRLADQWVDA
jgi:hypothetical protein